MLKKSLFLRGFCMAAALTLAAGSMPAAGLRSFAAVSEAETTEEPAEADTGEGAEAGAEADTDAETGTDGQSETGTEEQPEDSSEQDGELEDSIGTADEDPQEGEAADEDPQEGEAADGNDSGDKTEADTGEQPENPGGEENVSESGDGAETGIEAPETEADPDAETQPAAEENIEDKKEDSTETGEESDKDADKETVSEADETKEDDAETEKNEDDMPAEGAVEGTEAELIPETQTAEMELAPELLEAVNILSDVTATFDWPVDGETVASARQKVNITHSDTFKTCSIKYSTTKDGTALSDSTKFEGGKTYYVRFDISLKSSYYIDASTSISVNDIPISMNIGSSRWQNFNFYVYGTAEAGPSLSEMKVTFTWPDAGDTVADAKKTVKITNQDKIKSWKYSFRKSPDGADLADSAVFENGVTYYIYIDVTLKDGCTVDSSTKIWINDSQIGLNIPAGNKWSNFRCSSGKVIIAPDLTSLKELVNRFYLGCLGREGDEDGLQYWARGLYKKTLNGARLAVSFFESNEFVKQNVSDEEYIERLYQVFFGRPADPNGKAYWVDFLENGMSRRFVLSGFVSSNEFKTLCGHYGIEAGKVSLTENRDKNTGITSFLARIYKIALNRKFDVDGLNYWAGVILSSSDKKAKMRAAAQAFFTSGEFKSHNYDNSEIIKFLYRVFLNREADNAGLAYWLDTIANGNSIINIMGSFSRSNEFANLMAQYNIK